MKAPDLGLTQADLMRTVRRQQSGEHGNGHEGRALPEGGWEQETTA